MELTDNSIESYGFKRVNNSTFRKGALTVQNGYVHNGHSINERILTTKKAYKVCYKGKYVTMIQNTIDLNYVLANFNK